MSTFIHFNIECFTRYLTGHNNGFIRLSSILLMKLPKGIIPLSIYIRLIIIRMIKKNTMYIPDNAALLKTPY